MLKALDFSVAILALELRTALVLAGRPDRRAANLGIRRRLLKALLCWLAVKHGSNSKYLKPRLTPRLHPLPGAARRAFAQARGNAAQAAWTHPIMPCEAIPAGGQFSSFMPSDRPRCASTSLISVSDFLPRFGVFSNSTSVFWIRSPM